MSVTLVYCGQTVGCIKMKLGVVVDLGPGHIVLDDTAAPTLCVRIIRGSCLLWPNGWMDQDAIWYGGMPRPSRHCVKWGPSSPLQKEAQNPLSRNFRPMSIMAKRLDASR